jgi:response regulator RpfG family c-di-GMP phosphodiesterase
MKPVRFILIDDDVLNNNLCKLYIRHSLPSVEVVDFTLPERALIYIEKTFRNGNDGSSVLLLDINMPTMTGWDFLIQLDKLDEKIKSQITIYILSSSLDVRDKEKAQANKYVKGYIEKPIEIPVIKSLYDEQ